MEFIVYILFSESKNRFYIGFTSNLDERVIRHNQKSKGFTGSANDWKVVYTEKYETKEITLKETMINSGNLIINQNSKIQKQIINREIESKESSWSKASLIIALVVWLATITGVLWQIFCKQ